MPRALNEQLNKPDRRRQNNGATANDSKMKFAMRKLCGLHEKQLCCIRLKYAKLCRTYLSMQILMLHLSIVFFFSSVVMILFLSIGKLINSKQ